MAQISDGHEAHGAAPQVLTFGSPSVGDILADRYQVEDHLGGDAHGRQLYRGVDVVLRRPVTIVLRQPGGDSASEMLGAAVAASRVVHPHLVGVYDAIDEGERAYVVREWIDGVSLGEALAEGPLDAARSVAIAWAIADAVSALHENGVIHGNVNPQTVMIAQDGRVMLADARTSDDATEETDVRAIGGVLYSSLTGFWPQAEAGPAQLPDGIHQNGSLVSPREVRPDLPIQLDELAIGLLDPTVNAAPASTIAAELALMTDFTQEEELENSLDLSTFDGANVGGPPSSRRRIASVIGALIALALIGSIAAMRFGGDSPVTPDPSASTTQDSASSSEGEASTGTPTLADISGNQVRIILGPVTASSGDRSQAVDAEKTVDGDLDSGWETQHYDSADFGSMRPGMGVWIDLGSPATVDNVKVMVSKGGATVELLCGDSDPANGQSTDAGDAAVYDAYKSRPLAKSRIADGTTILLTSEDSTPVQYLLVWFTELPADSGGYAIEVNEIEVTVLQ